MKNLHMTCLCFLTVFSLSSCRPSLSVSEQLRHDAAGYLKCPKDQVQLKNYKAPTWLDHGHKFTAEGCGKEASCIRGFDGQERRPVFSCELTAEHEQASFSQQAIPFLSKQTACPVEEIQEDLDWKDAQTETVSRLNACEFWYLCYLRKEGIDCVEETELEKRTNKKKENHDGPNNEPK